MNDREFYNDLSQFTATMLSQRGSFFLVFESMLLTATSILTGKEGSFFSPFLLILLGIFATSIWLYVNYLQVVFQKEVYTWLKTNDDRIKSLLEKRGEYVPIYI